MNEKVKQIIKSPKLLIIAGICGILIIFLSSLIPTKKEDEQSENQSIITASEYCAQIEESVGEIVSRITGDTNPTVVVTLESGIKYSYAKADETDVSSSSSDQSGQSSESKKQSYITVKGADGSEQALLITEIMPEVRGVAIICKNGNDNVVAEKIESAVTAALNITSKRVYISGGTSNEKR